MPRRKRAQTAADGTPRATRDLHVTLDKDLAAAIQEFRVNSGHENINETTRELLRLGLAADAQDATLNATRRRALNEARLSIYRSMELFFGDLQRTLIRAAEEEDAIRQSIVQEEGL